MPNIGDTGTDRATGQRVVWDGRGWARQGNPLTAPAGMRVKPNPTDYKILQEEMANANTARRSQAELDNFMALNKNNATGIGYKIPFIGDGLVGMNPDLQAMQAIEARLTPAQRPAGSGATSDFEQRLYAKGIPSIGKMGESNRKIYNERKRDTQGQIARSDFMQSYAQANRGSTLGADAKWNEFVNTNPQDFNSWKQFYGLSPKPQPKRHPLSSYTPAQMQTLRSIKGLGGQGGSKTNPVMVTNAKQYNALPVGAWYIDDSGYYGVKGQDK